MKSIKDLVGEHPFFSSFDENVLDIVSGCAKNAAFPKDTVLATHGEPAKNFYLIKKGRIAINTFVPGQGVLTLQTVTDNELFGWSWIFPPYRWVFDAVTTMETNVLSFDGDCLRKKCDTNPSIGYPVMKQFARILVERLIATRIQLLDLYHIQSS